MNRANFSILFASLYLLLFLVLLHTSYDKAVWSLFLLSPLVVIYMVYSVLRYGVYTGTELKEGEEWGYEDVDKESAGFL